MHVTIIKAHYRKIFCENRIAAYDKTTETVAPLFNIKDAIYVAAEAWENVSQSVVWIKTGILPDNYFNTNLVPIYREPTEEFLNLDEIQSLIDQLPINMPLPANEFIFIDDVFENNESMPSESEIIEAVLNSNNNEEEEEEYNESISHNEVISNINNILNNDIKVDGSFIQRLCSFKRHVVYASIKRKRQVTLDRYMEQK